MPTTSPRYWRSGAPASFRASAPRYHGAAGRHHRGPTWPRGLVSSVLMVDGAPVLAIIRSLSRRYLGLSSPMSIGAGVPLAIGFWVPAIIGNSVPRRSPADTPGATRHRNTSVPSRRGDWRSTAIRCGWPGWHRRRGPSVPRTACSTALERLGRLVLAACGTEDPLRRHPMATSRVSTDARRRIGDKPPRGHCSDAPTRQSDEGPWRPRSLAPMVGVASVPNRSRTSGATADP